jgi:RNA polymerase sigma-70 factor (ECF subfamily)
MGTKNHSDRSKEDAELVRKALDGNEQAFARIMLRYKEPIYNMMMRMVQNKNDAEDLTLEALGKAFANLHLYSFEYAFSTWIYRIATNNCIDFLRKRRGIHYSLSAQEEENYGSLELKSTGPNPEEKMILKQRAVQLRRFIERLKPRYRKLIELRYFKDYSYDEIAKELDLPLGTIKVQLFRARNTLYELINETDVNE